MQNKQNLKATKVVRCFLFERLLFEKEKIYLITEKYRTVTCRLNLIVMRQPLDLQYEILDLDESTMIEKLFTETQILIVQSE